MAKPKQLVTLSEWEAYRYFMSSNRLQFDSEEFPYVSLFYPKLSVFFDKDERKLQLSYFKEYSITCTAIVVEPPKDNIPASVFCVIDVLKKEEILENSLEVKKQFFDQHKIPYCIFIEEIPNRPHYFNGFELLCEKSSIKLAGPFNYYQFASITSFFAEKASKKGEVFNIVYEPSLDMILTITTKDNEIIDKVNSEICKRGLTDKKVSKNYFKNTSVDAVFCVDMPYGIPLFAIEYDGHKHNEIDQQNKDIVKDLIFKNAGIPLIRVRSDYLRPSDHNNWEIKCKINQNITRQLLRAELNFEDYASRMLQYLKNEAENLKQINPSASLNIITLTKKLDLFLSRKYDEIKSITDQRDYYKKSSDAAIYETIEQDEREREELKEIEEGDKYGVPVKISTKRNKLDAITIDVKIEPQDEAYKSVGGNKSGFILGPYKIDDVTGFYQFDGLIEKMLREEAIQQLDEMFCSGTPSLMDKMFFYRISKKWKSFQDRHNSRVRWWLGELFFVSLIKKYSNDLYLELHFIRITQSPCEIIDKRLQALENPLLNVSNQQRKNVSQDLIILKDLINKDETFALFVRVIKTKELAECRNLVWSLVSELIGSNDDFSIFEVLKNKDILISVLEGANRKAKENKFNELKRTYKKIDYKIKAQYDKEIERIDQVFEIIKKRLFIVDVLTDPLHSAE